MKRSSAGHLAFTFATLPLLLLLAGPASPAEPENCAACHESVHVSAGGHAGLECIDCHTNATEQPHRPENLNKLSADQNCLQCHDAATALGASMHGELACGDCHGAPHEIAAPDTAVCAECHRKANRTVSRSVHADQASCIDCHKGVHSIVASGDAASPVAKVNQIHTCGACHQSPPEVLEGYLTSKHGKALLISGLDDAPGCTNCHGGHEATAIDNKDARTSHANSPTMCGECHGLTVAIWTKGDVHGKAWAEGDSNGPVCASCHGGHGFAAPHDRVTRLDFVANCGDCHAEYYTTYRDSFHGQATDLNMAAAATCPDCHNPHRNLPADDPGSSVNPNNLAATCGACHGETTASFLTFDPHSDPTDREANPEVYFVWLFMTGLLLAVFGFFALHDLLWLQRSLVGMARGEFKAIDRKGPYVRRFPSVTIRLHIAVVLTFLTLAATGLPLKFHWMGWAQTLIDLLGGLESARVLHRLAAIGTLGYAAFHLTNLFLRAARKERGIFWGFNSLIPQGQDVVDIFQNLRYFLYLGPKPAGGRWTYWEKFDYMAVFWGIPIIGLSGLMLWYPNFFSQLLPGWVLNAAHVIHSDEALLATGFIFVFHFFHTHMRPESFPMDPVIFTGRMTLERFKEERPLEYQRLADLGELESIAADPPTPAELRNAYIFGFSALAIGVALAVGIFWSIIATWMA